MPVALTKGKEIFDETNQLLADIRSFLPETDIRIRRLLNEADKLIWSNAADGYSAKAAVYQLTGNLDQVLKNVDNATKLSSEPILLANKCAYLLNLGLFSVAQEVYRSAVHPRKGLFGEKFHFGFACGAFQTMERFLEEAKKMKLDLEHLDTVTALRASHFLTQHKLGEEEVSVFLDVAGEIMRAQRVMFLDYPQVFISLAGTEPLLSFVFSLPIDSYRAEELDTDLQSRFVERFPEFPQFLSISFRSGLPSNERYAGRAVELRA